MFRIGFGVILSLLVSGGGTAVAASTTLYSENFNSYADGTIVGDAVGVGATAWSIDAPALLAGDYFEVRGGLLESADLNDVSSWTSPVIAIGGATGLTLSFDLSEEGDLEGPGCACGINADFVNVGYAIDGGAFVFLSSIQGLGGVVPDFGQASISGDTAPGGAFDDGDFGAIFVDESLGGVGNALQIVIQSRTTAATEILRLDNIAVTGTLAPVPLPGSLALLGMAALALGGVGRRPRR